MNKCVIASDSFKGTLSSKKITELFKNEFEKVFPNAKLETVVLGDGGENTLQVFENKFPQGNYKFVSVKGPNFKNVRAKYFTYDDVAVIELAESSGLSLATKRNPLETTTFGVGELIKDAYLKGYRFFYVALGGSSTNDGGCGLLSALGIKFLDKNNEEFIPTGYSICNIKNIDDSKLICKDSKFIILSDVKNPMFGKNGAACVFAKQKGANAKQIDLLDRNLKYLNSLFIKATGKDISNIAGTGAAGATAAGILAFLNADISSGINTILDLIDFDKTIQNADYVFTGEGKLDTQSFNGKLISGVLERTRRQNIRTICICGKTSLINIPDGTFEKVIETKTPHKSISELQKNASKYYSEAVKKVLQSLK